jgi:hypothetical protein
MTKLKRRIPDSSMSAPEQGSPAKPKTKGGHSHWLMMACCVPMLVIAVALVLAGGGARILVFALGCAAMMAVMMFAMSGGQRGSR